MSRAIPATAVILAGGRGERMGGPKEILDFGGVTLLEHAIVLARGMFSDVLVVARKPEVLPRVGAKVLRDSGLGTGPLAGICGGLEALESDYGFVFACDMPFVKMELVRLLWAYAGEPDVVVPRGEKGLEPLHAFYSRACLGPVRAALSEGKRRVVDFFEEVGVVEVGEEELSQVEDYEESFFNVNTLGEYERAVELMRRLEE